MFFTGNNFNKLWRTLTSEVNSLMRCNQLRRVGSDPCKNLLNSYAKSPCVKCTNRTDLRGMKYIQPEIPASFKPDQNYKRPCYALESNTIYKLSYPGVEGEMMKECKPKSTLVADNIRPSTHPFSQDTTFRLSYTGVGGEKAVSYKPLYRNMMGSGPMQCVTTHRHDYTPKVSERPMQHRMTNNILLSQAKMENNTTMSLSYQPVEVERVTSFKPQRVYKKSDFKFEQDTINRLSYQPWDPMPKEFYPWMKKDKYKQPCYAMENNTIYRASYLPVDGFERLPPFKPPTCIGTINKPFASATIYRESYQDVGPVVPPTPAKYKENIFLSTQPMSQDTTFRLSYTGIGGEKAVPYKPYFRNMMGSGPMQCVTTHRHDFTPKPFVQSENYKPPQTLPPSCYKMEDTTTFRASYLPNECMPKTESYKPVAVYRKSPYALESDTINRLSYQPWSPIPKEEYPWMKKPRYQQPCRAMDNTSIYRGSYMAPGNYVPDENSATGINCCDCTKLVTTATDDLC